MSLLSNLALFGSGLAQAGGSVGIDYFDSQISATELLTGRTAALDFNGPGFSLGWNVSDAWSLSISRSSNDGEGIAEAGDGFTRDLLVTSESTTNSIGVSYFGENFWARAGYSATKDNQNIRALNQITSDVTRDSDESQDGTRISLELGKDWYMGSWSPSLSVSLDHQTIDIRREINIGSSFDLEEEVSGTDIGVGLSLFYFVEVSEHIALVPSVGVFLQKNLDGEITGTARFSPSANSDRASSSRNYGGGLEDDELTTANASVSFLFGDWALSTGTQKDLSSDTSDQSWFAALSYNF